MERISCAIDSGAFSLQRELYKHLENTPTMRGYGHHLGQYANLKYLESDHFLGHVDRFRQFLEKHGRQLDFAVTVDIIYNAKATWRVYRRMTDELGMKVIPVFHFGSDPKWLRKYMDESDMIGIGGVVNRNRRAYMEFVDSVFEEVCDSRTGRPGWKLHGFAITAVTLMKLHPWYSVDSTTWGTLSRYAKVYMPKLVPGGADFLGLPRVFMFSEREEKAVVDYKFNIKRQPPIIRDHINRYLAQFYGLSIDDLSDNFGRDIANGGFHIGLQEQLKVLYAERFDYPEGGNVYLSGQAASGHSTEDSLCKIFTSMRRPFPGSIVRYLGSFSYPKTMRTVFDVAERINRVDVKERS